MSTCPMYVEGIFFRRKRCLATISRSRGSVHYFVNERVQLIGKGLALCPFSIELLEAKNSGHQPLHEAFGISEILLASPSSTIG